MSTVGPIQTARTVLRPWRHEDLPAFAALNADPRVTEFFPSTFSRAQSDAAAASIVQHFDAHGFGLWALEIPGRATFAGFVGLTVLERPLPQPGRPKPWFPCCAELGWRIAAEHWGQGYASEAAAAAVRHAFEQLGLERLVACTVPANQRSRRIMEKLGMVRDAAADFDHPRVPLGHPMRAHLLYRLERGNW